VVRAGQLDFVAQLVKALPGLHKIFYFLGPQNRRKYFLHADIGNLMFYLNLIITIKQDSVYSTHHFIRFEIKIDVFQRGYRINILYILI
jgi:hypothetical protein